MRRGLWLTGLAVLALSACTKKNPNYCADAGRDLGYSCSEYDAALHEEHAVEVGTEVGAASDASDASDGGEVGGDAHIDVSDADAAMCANDNQCLTVNDGGTPACGTRNGGAACVECTMDAHCKGAKGVCDKAAQKCVECLGTEAASGPECTAVSSRSVCDKMTQSCVGCIDNSNCAAATPICDATTKSCRICAADSECTGGPGICVDWDGHCATPAEVVTLQGGATCVASVPNASFCRSADATTALMSAPTRAVLLVKGTDPVAAIDIPTGTAAKVLVVGQGGATIGAGSGDPAGVHVVGASRFWVRDLKISGGTVGVVAETGAELHLTRCVVTNNDKGGIKTSNSSFDITNTIVAANGVGSDVGGVAFGGVRLGDIPASGMSRFSNNTVVDNLQVGISCKDPAYDISTSIVHGNVGGESINCAGAMCCGAGDPDPSLDATYHLMSGSPCIGKITATMSTLTVDIDRQPRPGVGGMLDCGADERQ
jgi:parallel beta helix pectate lyase-like protein